MSVTSHYSWTKPTVGGDDGAWGGEINSTLDAIDNQVFVVANQAASAASQAGSAQSTASTALGRVPGVITISAGAPTGGNDGDIWLQYS